MHFLIVLFKNGLIVRIVLLLDIINVINFSEFMLNCKVRDLEICQNFLLGLLFLIIIIYLIFQVSSFGKRKL